jgi:ribonuclease HII
MLRHEREAWANGYRTLAGVDEAGRGPLAGPVIAAAVYMSREWLECEADRALAGLTDSKRLSAARRSYFFDRLAGAEAVRIGVGRAEPAEIDEINILRATHLAMARAVRALGFEVDLLLVDGRPVPGLPCPARALVNGDARSLLIAAASVVAKVSRDREMEELDRRYPGYGLARHKGYGTAAHLAALRRLGPSPIHRRSFAPVRHACG